MAKPLTIKTESKKPIKPEKNNPAKVFKTYCEQQPWAIECKEYEV